MIAAEAGIGEQRDVGQVVMVEVGREDVRAVGAGPRERHRPPHLLRGWP